VQKHKTVWVVFEKTGIMKYTIFAKGAGMPKDAMTPRERWEAVIKHKKPDRIPMVWSGTPEIRDIMMRYLNAGSVEEMLTKLHIDEIVGIGPELRVRIPEGTDEYGCRFTKVSYGTGEYLECTYHPLAGFKTLSQIKSHYKFPTIDIYDFSVIPAQLKGKEHLPVYGGGCEPFLQYGYLRGLEQAMIDLVENPDIAEYCLEKIFSLSYEKTVRIYQAAPGKVLITTVAEDFGSQENLLFSPATIRQFFIPRMRKMMALAHENGAFVLTHSDGAIRAIIGDLIEAGMDILNPVQWRCRGMDRKELKESFGARIAFHGAMDNQYTMPFGTIRDVEKEVLDNISILGKDGGYILGPCHNFQSITPPENIVAMYNTAYENGWY